MATKIDTLLANATAWQEAMPNGASFAIQNQGNGELYIYISPNEPSASQINPSIHLEKYQSELFSVDAGDRVFYRSEQSNCQAIIKHKEAA